MEQKKEAKLRKTKDTGITLVALVVTIIILIILATISIRMVIGEGGLIWQANNAKVEHRAAEVEEEVLAWKTEHKLAQYANEIKPQDKDKFIDDQASRGLLTPEEAGEAKEKGQVKIGSKLIDYNIEETEQKGTLDVKIQVEQAKVTKTSIPVKVSATDENGEGAQNVTYTFYKNGEKEEVQDSTGEYTFDNLQEEEDYTLKVIATSENGATGEDEVKVKSLKMEYKNDIDTSKISEDFMYFRYEDGMTWGEWATSDYPRVVGEGNQIGCHHIRLSITGSYEVDYVDYIGFELEELSAFDGDQIGKGILSARSEWANAFGNFITYIRPQDPMPYYYYGGMHATEKDGSDAIQGGLFRHTRPAADCVFRRSEFLCR